jgi:hypothetical protein
MAKTLALGRDRFPDAPIMAIRRECVEKLPHLWSAGHAVLPNDSAAI